MRVGQEGEGAGAGCGAVQRLLLLPAVHLAAFSTWAPAVDAKGEAAGVGGGVTRYQ